MTKENIIYIIIVLIIKITLSLDTIEDILIVETKLYMVNTSNLNHLVDVL